MKTGHIPWCLLSYPLLLCWCSSGGGDGIRIGVIYIQRQRWPRDLPHERLLVWHFFHFQGSLCIRAKMKGTWRLLCRVPKTMNYICLNLSLYQALWPSLYKHICLLSPLCCCFWQGRWSQKTVSSLGCGMDFCFRFCWHQQWERGDSSLFKFLVIDWWLVFWETRFFFWLPALKCCKL